MLVTRKNRTGWRLSAATVAFALAFVWAPAAYAQDEHANVLTVTVPEAVPTPPPTNPPQPPPTTPPSVSPPATPTAPVVPQPAPRATQTTLVPGDSGGSQSSDSPPAVEPQIPRTPATNGAEARVDRADLTYHQGGNITITAEGFTGGEQVQVVLYSDPRLIGNVAANTDGTFSHTFALPTDLPTGKHTVQLTGWESKRVAVATLLVTEPPTAAEETASAGGFPSWLWWIIGTLLVILLALAFWRIVLAMRERTAEGVTA